MHQNIDSLKTWLNSRIDGQQQPIGRIIITLLLDSHLLVEGTPELAKKGRGNELKPLYLTNEFDQTLSRITAT